MNRRRCFHKHEGDYENYRELPELAQTVPDHIDLADTTVQNARRPRHCPAFVNQGIPAIEIRRAGETAKHRVIRLRTRPRVPDNP